MGRRPAVGAVENFGGRRLLAFVAGIGRSRASGGGLRAGPGLLAVSGRLKEYPVECTSVRRQGRRGEKKIDAAYVCSSSLGVVRTDGRAPSAAVTAADNDRNTINWSKRKRLGARKRMLLSQGFGSGELVATRPGPIELVGAGLKKKGWWPSVDSDRRSVRGWRCAQELNLVMIDAQGV